LAADFGVSDVAIAKACKRYAIPKPPLGYWARIQAGQKVPKPKLPPAPPNRPAIITFATQDRAAPPDASGETAEKIAEEQRQENEIFVSESLKGAHALVRKTRDAFSEAYVDDYGRSRPKGEGCLNLCVAKGSLHRALRIWDALIKALEKRNHSVDVVGESGQWARNGTFHTRFVINGESIEIRMEEPASRFDRTPTEKERKWGYWKKWDYTPSGKLNFVIETYVGDGHQRNWADSEKHPMEKRLNSLVASLLLMSDSLKQKRVEIEREEKARKERQRRAEELERERLQEVAKIQDLEAKATMWERSERIRSFIIALEQHLDGRSDEHLTTWVAWAKAYVEKLDPIGKMVKGS
jgi:hypothetical protein